MGGLLSDMKGILSLSIFIFLFLATFFLFLFINKGNEEKIYFKYGNGVVKKYNGFVKTEVKLNTIVPLSKLPFSKVSISASAPYSIGIYPASGRQQYALNTLRKINEVLGADTYQSSYESDEYGIVQDIRYGRGTSDPLIFERDGWLFLGVRILQTNYFDKCIPDQSEFPWEIRWSDSIGKNNAAFVGKSGDKVVICAKQ